VVSAVLNGEVVYCAVCVLGRVFGFKYIVEFAGFLDFVLVSEFVLFVWLDVNFVMV